MTLIVFPSKTTVETKAYPFDFNGKLEFGEGISGATIAVTVFSGIDPNPSIMVTEDAPTITGGIVTQNIQGGLPGVIYSLSCVAVGTQAHNYSKEGRLAVITPGGRYTAL